MTDLNKAVHEMNLYLENCPEKGRPGFRLKTVHTYHVMRNAGIIAEAMRLSEEDIQLAKLIGLLKEKGFMTYSHENMILISPPLIITPEQIREEMAKVDEVLFIADEMAEKA